MFQIEKNKKIKTYEKDLNKTEERFTDKELKIRVTDMPTDVRTMHEQSENFNKETENIRKYKTETTKPELKNTIIALKNSRRV